MAVSALHDAALQVQFTLQGQACSWGDLSFLAIVSAVPAPSSPDPRGLSHQEHELQLLCRLADFPSLPADGATLTVAGTDLTIARIPPPVPGAAHFFIVCREAVV